jgi:hypothetical protein
LVLDILLDKRNSLIVLIRASKFLFMDNNGLLLIKINTFKINIKTFFLKISEKMIVQKVIYILYILSNFKGKKYNRKEIDRLKLKKIVGIIISSLSTNTTEIIAIFSS